MLFAFSAARGAATVRVLLALSLIISVLAFSSGAASAQTQLETPVVNSAEQQGESIVFGWTAIAGRAEYHVQWFFPSGHNVYGATQDTSFTVDTEGIAGQFCLEVRAVYPGRDSDLSNRLCHTAVADSAPPSRPGFNGYTVDAGTTTYRWKTSTDDVGVVGYRARLEGTSFDVTLPASARSHTFTGVPARDGRYVWNITALDGAGNPSVARRTSIRVLSDTASAATVTAVDDVIDALEQWAADRDSFVDIGGNNGQGWFNLSNGSSYPTKMAANLIDAGYLDEQYRNIYYWDLMVYRCDTGTDDERVGVFSTAHTATTSAADLAAWDGCTQNPVTKYGHDHYRVSDTLAEIRAAAQDTTAPTRPGWGTSYWAVGPDAIFISWGESTDDVGVTGYRVELRGTDIDVTLSKWSSSYIFSGLEPGRYQARVSAFDAAGNVSKVRGIWLRVDTAADRAGHRAAVDDIVSAIELYAARYDTLRVDGGAWSNGYGWFNYSNTSSYPTKISQRLIDEGLLDPSFADVNYSDYMVYICGSGDTQRAAVFTEDGVTGPAAADVTAWNGCTKSPFHYGKNYYKATASLGDIRDAQGSTPITGLQWSGDGTYAIATFDAPGVDVEWRRDGVVVSESADYPNSQWWFDHEDISGQLCVRARHTGPWFERCLAHIDPEVSVTSTGIDLSWTDVSYDPNVTFIAVEVDGSLAATVAATATSATVSGLQPTTNYEVGVYPVSSVGGEHPRNNDQTIFTAPTPRVAFEIADKAASTVLVRWSPVENDPALPVVEAYGVTVNGEVVEWMASSETVYRITGLTADTTYDIGVYAVDTSYNTGPRNRDLVVTTRFGDDPPVQPVLGIWDYSDTSITVRWGYTNNIAPDDSGPVTYRLILDGQRLEATMAEEELSYTFRGLWPSTAYTVQVEAIDEDGNTTTSPVKTQTTSAQVLVPNPAPPADNTAPIWGSGVKAPQISVDVHRPTSVDLSWCCALDYDQYDVVPASFDLYAKPASSSSWTRIVNLPAFQTGGSYNLSNIGGAPLVTNQLYSVRIVAIDRAGNRSEALERHNVQPRSVAAPDVVDASSAPDPEPWRNPPPSTTPSPPIPNVPTPETVPPTDVETPVGSGWNCTSTTFTKTVDSHTIRLQWSVEPNNVLRYQTTALNLSTLQNDGGTSYDVNPDVRLTQLQAGVSYIVWVSAYASSADGPVKIGACPVKVTTDSSSIDPPQNLGECRITVRPNAFSADVSWTSSSPDSRLYKIFLSSGENLAIEVGRTTSTLGTEWELFNLRLGGNYEVSVVEYDLSEKPLGVCQKTFFTKGNDRDGDTIIDDFDNCPDDPNPQQIDLNGDGIGVMCSELDVTAPGDNIEAHALAWQFTSCYFGLDDLPAEGFEYFWTESLDRAAEHFSREQIETLNGVERLLRHGRKVTFVYTLLDAYGCIPDALKFQYSSINSVARDCNPQASPPSFRSCGDWESGRARARLDFWINHPQGTNGYDPRSQASRAVQQYVCAHAVVYWEPGGLDLGVGGLKCFTSVGTPPELAFQ